MMNPNPENTRNIPFQSALLTLLALLTFGLVGCGDLVQTSEVAGRTKIRYNNDVMNALEEVFSVCTEPLELESGTDEINFIAGCSTQVGSLSNNAADLYLALGLAGPISLSDPIPSHLKTIEKTVDGFSWPVQNCEVNVTADVYFDQLNLYDLQGKWTTYQGKPALKVDFDFSEKNIGHIVVDAEVDCPKSLSKKIVNAIAGSVLDELNGTHTINTWNRDLDLYVTFDHTDDEIVAQMAVEFSVGSLSIDIDWNQIDMINMPWPLKDIDGVDRDDIEGPALNHLETAADSMLGSALDVLPDYLEEVMESSIPDGHIICDIEIKSSGLNIYTDDPDTSAPCQVFVQKTILPAGLMKKKFK